MGRYDFRPARVRQTAAMLLSSKRIPQQPPWFQVMHDIPPSEILVRTQPVQHVESPRRSKVRKASKLFQPQRIAYQEDQLRREFFSDHPWELARPRVILENDGKDHQKWDWSQSNQPGRPNNGESVIQRQQWLMIPIEEIKKVRPEKLGLPKDKAYDQARKELYEQRHFEEIEARVAREEALAVGAYFGQSALEVGMQLENKTFEQWKVWAQTQVTLMEQARNAAYTGLGTQTTAGEQGATGSGAEDANTLEAAAELLGPSIPGSKKGQEAKGGAAFRP